jgi:hypothetical protein
MKKIPMRWLFLVLVLVNLLFFSWHQWQQSSVDAAAQIAGLQVNPEKIRPLAADTAVPQRAPPKAAPTAAATVEACAEWGLFSGPEVARADGALAALGLPAEVLQRRVTDIDGYWVHLPVQKTRVEADRKAAELRGLGVSDFYIVQEPPNWRNAISLAVFKNEELANAELERLRKLGVRSAVMTRRESFFKQVSYLVRDPGRATIARISELQREFPGAELKAVTCPADMLPAKNNQ